LRYVDARTCRHDFVLRYFGDEQELLGGCGHCDICEALDGAAETPESDAQREEAAIAVRKALSAVARAQQRAGMGAIAEMLHGVDSDRTRRFGFTRLSTFGLMKDRPIEWIGDLLRALLAAGWIDLTATDHPVPFLTRSGGEMMRGRGQVRFSLPPERRAMTKKSREPREAAAAPVDLGEALCGLFDRLRAHRAAVARTRGVPAYVVALDRTLVEMATYTPRTREELLGIYGMGPARVEQYGDGFLEVLRT
jgi:ATP-dependent DNA helicase RecQ